MAFAIKIFEAEGDTESLEKLINDWADKHQVTIKNASICYSDKFDSYTVIVTYEYNSRIPND